MGLSGYVGTVFIIPDEWATIGEHSQTPLFNYVSCKFL